MSTFDPINLGRHIQQSYSKYLIGGNQRGYQSLLDDLVVDDEADRDRALIRSKGPYIEAIPSIEPDVPWRELAASVTGEFAPNGLDRDLISAFDKLGFEDLYQHQADGIKALIDDQHALISAGTGRGKTEAWFIPILQYALKAKQNELPNADPNGIKAVLTYPTKALAQDQLRRFIEYLWVVNRETDLPEDLHLTIGVYDGDTIRRGQRKDGMAPQTYLQRAFKYFELPESLADEFAVDEVARKEVDPRVNVIQEGQSYYLQSRPEYGQKTLEFVHLTRSRMENNPPDIILTNPDAINYRLFNINDAASHQLFVDQPKFLVFDEVHAYEGVFGANVSMLIKRLRRLREAREVDRDLRIIGASATVAEREPFFQRLFNIPEGGPYAHIREDTDTGEKNGDERITLPGTIPSVLTESRYSAEEFREIAATIIDDEVNDVAADGSGTVRTSLGPSPATYDDPEEYLAAAIDDGELACITHLHEVLQSPDNVEEISDAPRPDDYIRYIKATYDVERDTAEIVAENSLELFDIANLETRIHVFNWPVDGYYKCVHCQSLYPKPQSCDCDEGGSGTHFVSKIRLCSICSEQVYEAWYCTDCGTVRPVTHETEGEYLYASTPECGHANHGELIRIYWTPEYQCADCDREITPSDQLGSCDEEGCSGTLTRTTEGVVCRNPECQAVHDEHDTACTHCGGTITLSDGLRRECSNPDCSLHDETQSGLSCDSCDSPLVPKLSLPWICTNENNPHRHSPYDIGKHSDCSRNTYVLPAYVDTQSVDYCVDCNQEVSGDKYYAPGTGCAKEGHNNVVQKNISTGLRILYRDRDGNIRLSTPSRGSHALPCYHGRSRNFDPLMRAPSSAGVTMSQFLLRKMADDADNQKAAKLMSFADSYRDMERLANDFDEPENLMFAQQTVLEHLEDAGELTLEELLNETYEEAKSHWSDLGVDTQFKDVYQYSEWAGTVTGDLIEGYYMRFRGERESGTAELVTKGMVDIEFDTTPDNEAGNAVCDRLLEQNGLSREDIISDLDDSERVDKPMRALNSLDDDGIVDISDRGFVRLDTSNVRVRFVDSGRPIQYRVRKDQFISSAELQISGHDIQTVDFTDPYTDRTGLDSPHFDRTAYWAGTTETRLLIGEVYKGSLDTHERRKREHQFKRRSIPNFLSTGPAMEVGIDIGNLNVLLLMGTPPNTNAYLQRIGRAGRDAGTSLVITISKRNPIDFYYHKQPDELIDSKQRPVPLNQHNEYVLEAALTWALMDYIAAHYSIPWEKVESIDENKFNQPQPSEWDRFKKDSPTDTNDFESFTSLYYAETDEVRDGQSLLALGAIVENDEKARQWLEEILEYTFCKECGRIFEGVSGSCPACAGELRVANEQYREIIRRAREKFEERMLRFAYDYKKELEEERDDYKEQYEEYQDKIDELSTASGWGEISTADENAAEIAELERKQDRVSSELETVKDLLKDYEDANLSTIHNRSSQSQYAPELRQFGDNVAVTRYWEDRNGEVQQSTTDGDGRDAAMALRELHPYAYRLEDKQGYVVTRIHEDPEETRALKKTFGPQQIRCKRCNWASETLEGAECPECGADESALSKVEPIGLQRVEEHSDRMSRDQNDVIDVYPLATTRNKPEGTFPHVDTEVDDFTIERSIPVEDETDDELFRVEHGNISIVETVDSFTTSYRGGTRDPGPESLTICQHGECNSIVVKDQDGDDVCLRDPSHDTDDQIDVVVGRTFETRGLHVSSDRLTEQQVHTLAHGLRLGLQRTGGVSIRSLQEHFEPNDAILNEAYIFESSSGGNGVTDLLFTEHEGEWREFADVLEVIHDNIDECECSGGCPECVYQYGCSVNNDETSLDKEATVRIVSQAMESLDVSSSAGE
jgi:ATP-dependent helicase YprA (DUF1998 family)